MYKCLQTNAPCSNRSLPVVRLSAVVQPSRCCPKRASHVRCQASKAKSAKARRPAPAKKGFGVSKGAKQQEPWEKQLIPSYRVYYKPGFKPPRFHGSIELKKFEDGSVGAVASEDANGAELLVVSHPVAFLEGSLGSPPSVEDLHVSLLEAEISPSVTKVLSYLPRRPVAAAAAAKSAPAAQPLAGTADPAADATSTSQPSPQQQSAAGADEQELPPSFAHLLVQFWDQVGTFAVNKLSSKQLMRMLQASCWSEEVQDPAASQVRHERPTGFIGIWPEFAFMRHSCTPNTSVVVVDRYMLLHATDDITKGEEYTVNKLGSVIAAPLAARQAAHEELFGRPCRCRRCQLEQQLSPEVAEQLQSVHDKAKEWPQMFQDAMIVIADQSQSPQAEREQAAELINELVLEVPTELEALEEAMSEFIPDVDDRRIVMCGVYNAFDFLWLMEELVEMETPNLDKLANCVALLRLFARGSESHMYSAMALDELYSMRAQALSEEASKMKRKTVARQRQLTLQIQQLVAGAQAAAFANAEAITCRYGMLPDEGLIQQLQQGLTMFYTGLTAISAAKGEGLDEVPEVTRNLTIDGIPVTVVDTVEGSAFAGDEGLEVGRPGGAAAGQRVKVDWLEAPQEDDQQESDDLSDAAALEAAAESALAAAVAQLEAEGAAGQLTASS